MTMSGSIGSLRFFFEVRKVGVKFGDAFDHGIGLVAQPIRVAGEFVSLPELGGDAAHTGEEVRAMAEDSGAFVGLDENSVDVAAEGQKVIAAVEIVLGLHVCKKFF